MKKVSIIIPIYNVEKYVKKCIDSAVNQTLDDYEIIIVDDGSPDRSAEIAEGYAQKHQNIKILKKKNGGLSSARNAGLEVARGKYVYFIDSDDYIKENTIEELYFKAEKENLDIVYFNAAPLFESEEIRMKNQNYINYYNRSGDYSLSCSGQVMFANMYENREWYPSACLQFIRRDFIEKNKLRFYEGIIHEDNLFSFKAVMQACKVGYIDKAYYYRIIRDDSIMTQRKSMRNVKGYLVSYREMISFLHEIKIDKTVESSIERYLYQSIYKNACNIFNSLDEKEKVKELDTEDFLTRYYFNYMKSDLKRGGGNTKIF